MSYTPTAKQVVERLVNDDVMWEKIFAIREMNCFVIGMPNDVSARYNKVTSILPDPESCLGINGMRWLIKSKHSGLSIQITRHAYQDFSLHIVDEEESVQWLEGVDCYKHALLHVYDVIAYLMNSR